MQNTSGLLRNIEEKKISIKKKEVERVIILM